MNTRKLVTSFLLVFSMTNVFAKNSQKVVYGEDGRLDLLNVTNPLYLKLAKSTAAMIANKELVKDGDMIAIKSGKLSDDGICTDEKFADQPNIANCSGFLIGDRYLVTAGHCITSEADCRTNAWVFDYSISKKGGDPTSALAQNVYQCSKIIARKQDDANTKTDFALIQLDRKVEGRSPLAFRTKGKISDNQSLLVIGHPSGLPTKIADGAFVRSNDEKNFFVANLDTFGGNSGSAVFDSKTGTIEGILVRGENDYTLDSKNDCYRVKKCKMDECRGEDVTRMTSVEGLSKI